MSEELERLKLDLEKRKVELEELRQRRESRFFNKNFGVIITGIISPQRSSYQLRSF